HEDGLLTRGTYHRQVGGDPLIEIDQLVDLLPREGTATAYQLIEPLPLLGVCRHEHVDIHAGDPTGSPAGRCGQGGEVMSGEGFCRPRGEYTGVPARRRSDP